MNPINSIRDIDRFASMLTAELHIGSAALGKVVLQSLAELGREDLAVTDLKMRLADSIEDGMGYLGDGLHNHLSAEAMKGWRHQCARAFDKALIRSSSSIATR